MELDFPQKTPILAKVSCKGFRNLDLPRGFPQKTDPTGLSSGRLQLPVSLDSFLSPAAEVSPLVIGLARAEPPGSSQTAGDAATKKSKRPFTAWLGLPLNLHIPDPRLNH